MPVPFAVKMVDPVAIFINRMSSPVPASIVMSFAAILDFAITSYIIIIVVMTVIAVSVVGLNSHFIASRNLEAIEEVYMAGQNISKITSQLMEPINRLREVSLSVVLAPDSASREKAGADYDKIVNHTEKQLAAFMTNQLPEDRKYLKTIENLWAQYKKASAYTRDQIQKDLREAAFVNVNTVERKQFQALKAALQKWQQNAVQHASDKFAQTSQGARKNMKMLYVLICLIIAGVAGMIFWISGSITKPIGKIIRDLRGSSGHVNSASNQLSSASQQLADGSSEQAASIEETSASLEEMSSMTKQNAGNAHQADKLVTEANIVVGEANDSMGLLIKSMEEISQASEETSKIVKTIDEIAFQTNLLALNAAVEAARAGEAGAGFAVVADEVRNLALRTAEAAKNTAELIESNVKKSIYGSELVTSTNDAFLKVSKSTEKVAQLVSEIAAASNEQSKGIDQVNKAVAEVDKVIQQNAANAEETASASKELDAQSQRIKQLVHNLEHIVAGRNGNGTSAKASKTAQAGTVIREHIADKRRENELILRGGQQEVKPSDIIPMDDSDFSDF